MSNIEQNLQKILSSRYGKDVRQSIHDGIHDCYEDGKAGAVDLVARERIDNLVANNNPTEGNSELLDIRVGADGTAYDSAGEAVRKQVFAMDKLINFITPIFNIMPNAKKTWSHSYNSDTKTHTITVKNTDITFGYAKLMNRTFDVFVISAKKDEPDFSDDRTIVFDQNISYVNTTGFVALAGDLEESSMKLEQLSDAYLNNHYVFAVMYKNRIFTGPNQELFDELDYVNDFIREEIKRDVNYSELLDIRVGADGTAYDSAGEAVRKQVFAMDKLINFITPIFNIMPNAKKTWSHSYNSDTKTHTITVKNTDITFGYAKLMNRTFDVFVISAKKDEPDFSDDRTIVFDQNISYVNTTGFVALAGDLEESSMKLEQLSDAYLNNHYVFAVMYKNRIFTGPNQELFDELDYVNDFIREEIKRDVIDHTGNVNIIDSEQRRNLLSSFRSIGVIGDSLSVGHLHNTETEVDSRRNLYYSWPQYMARKTGQHIINMGESGYNVKMWMESEQYGWGVFSKEDNYCQAYIIGLGVNDSSNPYREIPLGSISDVNLSDYTLNGDTYYGGYAKIIQRGRTIRPNSIFFCLTDPVPTTKGKLYNQAIRDVVEYLNDNKVFVVDLYENYRQYYESPYFIKEDKNAIISHYSPLGYEAMVPIISAACSEVMEENLDIFCQLFTIDDAFETE